MLSSPSPPPSRRRRRRSKESGETSSAANPNIIGRFVCYLQRPFLNMGNCIERPRNSQNLLIASGNPASDAPQHDSHPLPTPPPVLSFNEKDVTGTGMGTGRGTRAVAASSPRSEMEILSSPNLKSFSLNTLKHATDSFNPESLIGEGGFGYVYKGWLDERNLSASRQGVGLVVAVKKLKPEGFQGHKEWLSEVNYLGQLHHPNLVKLIGYCLDRENRLLVYEFMPRGSLENHLFRTSTLTGSEQPLCWALRIKVAIGAACGLSFLHSSESQVIYRDFKASNILLDLEFNAKLSDFGLAKAGPTGDLTHVSTEVMGTQGYAAPEYLTTGRLTVKCDVYSFGVVLLELLTGRRAVDKRRVGPEQKLLDWVTPLLKNKRKLCRIMDTKLEGQYPQKGAYVAAHLALQCVHDEPRYRPHMADILTILEKLQSPKLSSKPDPLSAAEKDSPAANPQLEPSRMNPKPRGMNLPAPVKIPPEQVKSANTPPVKSPRSQVSSLPTQMMKQVSPNSPRGR